jgi:hypothetical protein
MVEPQRILHIFKLITQRVFLILRPLVLPHHGLGDVFRVIERLGEYLSVGLGDAAFWGCEEGVIDSGGFMLLAHGLIIGKFYCNVWNLFD